MSEINWTPEQQEVIDYLLKQVDSPEGKNVVVSGSGGTGKTTIICELICRLLASGHKVAVTAMTGKATAVLRNKVNAAILEKEIKFDKDNLLIETVSKITKIAKVMNVTTDGETKYTNTWRRPEQFDYDVLFVDELSMVPSYVAKWWQMAGCRVFGFGDECQLPEVRTSETGYEIAAFEHDLRLPHQNYVSGYGIKALQRLAELQLHKVLRSDNEVAILCHELRDFSKTKGEIVQILKKYAKEYEHIGYSTSVADVETDPEWQILAYTNKMCQEWNDKLCIGGDAYPDLEDKLLLFDNINPLRLYNGDTIKFKDFIATINRYNARALANGGRRVNVCMKWRGRMPRKDGGELERMFWEQTQMYYRLKAEVDAIRMAQTPGIIKISDFAPGYVDDCLEMFEMASNREGTNGEKFNSFLEYLTTTNIDMYQFVANRVAPSPMLYFVKTDYGYCVTTHKSQGSEYPKVCYLLERFDKPLLYTGLSRAKTDLKIINLTSTR